MVFCFTNSEHSEIHPEILLCISYFSSCIYISFNLEQLKHKFLKMITREEYNEENVDEHMKIFWKFLFAFDTASLSLLKVFIF